MVDSSKHLDIPYMYRKMMTPEEQFSCMKSFKNFDKSGDGVIELSEF
jgi:Ca2+-binding EF-hand superfamily protein